MKINELENIIIEGENLNIEFKRKVSSPEKIAKEMIAFANTKGGIIFFGIDDDKTIVGVNSEKEELELISTSANFFCDPPVKFEQKIIYYKHKDIILISVPESRKKPHYLFAENKNNRKAFIRQNDESLIASKVMINIMKSSNLDSHPVTINFGETEKTLLKYLSENKTIDVKILRKIANISERRASRTLVNLVRANVILHNNLNDKEYFTLAN
jgi:predicted HTH transcriptional regulator